MGFRNKDRVVILVEAQSTWSVNIVVRALLYLAQTWNEYITTTKQNRYGSRKLELPKPEMYVIFTGIRQDKPEYLSLADEFFGGEGEFLDAKVKMLYGDAGSAPLATSVAVIHPPATLAETSSASM